MTSHSQTPRLAVLIDADNASPRIAEGLFEKIATLGEASVRRIYGDFSGERHKSWSQVMPAHALLPHHNLANTVGKNASDIALVIDAMDLLHSGRFDGFCLVSSDSDFTRLAARIREQGVDVFGFGEQKTPQSFIMACKQFFYTENLLPLPLVMVRQFVPNPPPPPSYIPPVATMPAASVPQPTATATPAATPKPETVAPQPSPAPKEGKPPIAAARLILKGLAQMDDDDGWVHLSPLGTHLRRMDPAFDPRNYGCAKLSTLVEKAGGFETRRDGLEVYLRPKAAKS